VPQKFYWQLHFVLHAYEYQVHVLAQKNGQLQHHHAKEMLETHGEKHHYEHVPVFQLLLVQLRTHLQSRHLWQHDQEQKR